MTSHFKVKIHVANVFLELLQILLRLCFEMTNRVIGPGLMVRLASQDADGRQSAAPIERFNMLELAALVLCFHFLLGPFLLVQL